MLLALALLLLGYLVPHLTHARQLVLDSRVEDRFSAGLRVLDHHVARHPHSSGRGPALHTPSPEAPMTSPRLAARGTAGSAPAGVGESARALAAARARRAARRANRVAAARRRLILTAALLLVSVASWTAVGLTALAWTMAAIPTALVAAVLIQGRRVAIQGQQTDRRERELIERLEAQMQAAARASSVPGAARRSPRAAARAADRPENDDAATSAQTTAAPVEIGPSASSPAGALESRRPALASTTLTRAPRRSVSIGAFQGTGEVPQVTAAPQAPAATAMGPEAPAPVSVAPQAEAQAAEAPAEKAADVAPAAPEPQRAPVQWTPTPVPPPSYTLKPASGRREVAPYESGHIPQVSVPQRPMPGDMTASVSPAEAAAEPAPPALDLNAVLARRRAAGA
ncbi:hypothetical protein EDD31_1784 [Bogoriella caseilytica]|uniref:Uncharacterized protein n=1 Tax=Bogoriella caseilytica TaxID=56055 RepID=A0A3N2BDT2_9MICO|nr:hypothetical protein EDD31_1784 [Bogoriella caseilytica]